MQRFTPQTESSFHVTCLTVFYLLPGKLVFRAYTSLYTSFLWIFPQETDIFFRIPPPPQLLRRRGGGIFAGKLNCFKFTGKFSPPLLKKKFVSPISNAEKNKNYDKV